MSRPFTPQCMPHPTGAVNALLYEHQEVHPVPEPPRPEAPASQSSRVDTPWSLKYSTRGARRTAGVASKGLKRPQTLCSDEYHPCEEVLLIDGLQSRSTVRSSTARPLSGPTTPAAMDSDVEHYEYLPDYDGVRDPWPRSLSRVQQYSYRDYGNRTCFLDVRHQVLRDLAVLDHYPEIAEAMVQRNWDFMATRLGWSEGSELQGRWPGVLG